MCLRLVYPAGISRRDTFGLVGTKGHGCPRVVAKKQVGARRGRVRRGNNALHAGSKPQSGQTNCLRDKYQRLLMAKPVDLLRRGAADHGGTPALGSRIGRISTRVPAAICPPDARGALEHHPERLSYCRNGVGDPGLAVLCVPVVGRLESSLAVSPRNIEVSELAFA